MEYVDESRAWWESRRRRYNIGLLLAGCVAFLCYVFVIEWAPADSLRGPTGEGPEITLFTIAFQGIGYVVAVAIANVFYNLGPLSERLVAPAAPRVFRERLFRLGFIFSLALPFAVPVLIGIKVLFWHGAR